MGTQGRRRTTVTTGIQLSSEIHLMILFTTVWALLSFEASSVSFPEVCELCTTAVISRVIIKDAKTAPSGSARVHLGPDFCLTNLFRSGSLNGD